MHAENDEPGPRFDKNVPVETVRLPSAISTTSSRANVESSRKLTYPLAERPGSYVVLCFAHKTIKRLDTGKRVTPSAAPTVLEKIYADVSFLAGMLIDKFLYYLPLYRRKRPDYDVVLCEAPIG